MSCLNIGFILTFLKKLMLRSWQRLLINWEFYNQFSEVIFFVPNMWQKWYVPDKILSCFNIGFILTFLKKRMLKIWQRLLKNWVFYNQFSKGSFFCPILVENCTPLKTILSCLNIGFILTFLKKLMLRIWQRLLQNWAFYNQFSKVTFLCPIHIENRTPLKKFLGCLNVGLILTVLKKLMLRIWQRLLQNWVIYNQFSKVIFLCPILIENCHVPDKILCCLNIGFILTCLKKLMQRIWQRLLQNWVS